MTNHPIAPSVPSHAELQLRQAAECAECGYGAPDIETSRRLHHAFLHQARRTDRPVRLADVRKVM